MLRLPVDTEVEFDSATVVLTFPGSFEIEHTGVVAMLKDERGTLHLKKSDGGFVEIPPSYLSFEVKA